MRRPGICIAVTAAAMSVPAAAHHSYVEFD
jgi:hypothetical protein